LRKIIPRIKARPQTKTGIWVGFGIRVVVHGIQLLLEPRR
jgi:hypothetical protein